MKTELLHILQHSVGADQFGQGGGYRNHYVAGGRDVALCRQLEKLGFMREYPMHPDLTGGSPCFTVTAAGKEAIAKHSPEKPPEPKRTRAQQRYRDYCHDDFDCSFAEYLGINPPRLEFRHELVDRRLVLRYRYIRFSRHRYHDWDTLEGKWCGTMKEAKASYKAALAARRHA